METTKESLNTSDFFKYYSAEVWCWNCGKKQHTYIIKGMPAHEVAKECVNCGCMVNMKTGGLVIKS